MNALNITRQVLGDRAAARLPNAPSWTHDIDNPYLHGFYAPNSHEVSADHLKVISGEIPKDLHGAYLRNGPDPVWQPNNRYHWFDGDGKIYGIWFEDGKARFQSKWIHTNGWLAEQTAHKAVWPGMMGPFDPNQSGGPIKDTANTDLVAWNGRVLGLWYNAGQPYALDPATLETRGAETFSGALTHSLSAHSKPDERTGEFLFFTYGDEPPYMTFGIIGPDGKLLHRTGVETPGPRLPHDMGFTENYAVLHDLPFFHDVEILKERNQRVVRFHRDMPARFGLLPRQGDGTQIKWIEAEPCYIYHIVNCWEEGDEVVMDACRCDDPMPKKNPAEGELASLLAYLRLQARLHRWRFNLKTGRTREEVLDDRSAEFPKINSTLMGRQTRYSYIQEIPALPTLRFTGLLKYDTQTGAQQYCSYGEGVQGQESPFAPRIGSKSEDDGYVITFTTHAEDWHSECWIFDARDITQGPICRIALPQRVPAGFHTCWVDRRHIQPA